MRLRMLTRRVILPSKSKRKGHVPSPLSAQLYRFTRHCFHTLPITPSQAHLCLQSLVVPWRCSRHQRHYPLRDRAAGPLSSPAQPSHPFSNHILFSSPLWQGAGSADLQEAVSHHWSVLGFSGNELWVMCIQEERRTVQDFPPCPLLFLALIGKAISEEVPPTRALKAHKPTGKQRSHIIPMLIAAGTAVLPLGETHVAQTPKSSSNLLNLCIFCIPAGKISCPPNIGHKT